MRCLTSLVALVFVALAGGCATAPPPMVARAQAPDAEGTLGFAADQEPKKDEKGNGDKKEVDKKDEDKIDEPEGPAKTLFEWAIGPKAEKKDDEEVEEDVIVTDRPDFTEASSTVGRSRIQLEAGYTYFRDKAAGAKSTTQTYPEALFRIGLTEWAEFRIAPTYIQGREEIPGQLIERPSGWADLYLGVKFGLTEQKECLPETALIVQAFIPTGSQNLTADQVLPGANFLFGWDVIPDCLSAGGSFQGNKIMGDNGEYVLLAQSFSLGYELTKRLGMYTEWFAFYPTGAGETAKHYVDGGFTYKVTSNFQLDIRYGYGLSESATDYFTGAGFAVRY